MTAGIGADLAVRDRERPVPDGVEVVGQVLRTAVVRIRLPAGHEHGEEVLAVGTEPAGGRAAVQPDELLPVVDVAVDPGIAVLAAVVAVDSCVVPVVSGHRKDPAGALGRTGWPSG
jgi:hypothetical protein